MTNTTKSHTADHEITLADGRTLAIDDNGPPDGPVVVFLHSGPGSRRIDPDPEATAAAGVRLLTVDRPGYGLSTPGPEGSTPSVAAVADDIAAALDQLGVQDAAIAGWSYGGRYALAIAARRPDLVRSVALIATPAPDEEVRWVQEQHRGPLAQMKADPSTAAPMLSQAFAPITEDPDLYLNQVGDGPADVAALEADPAMAARAQAMIAEAFRQGALGIAADIVACEVAPRDFDPAAVGAPVALFYDEDDVAVTPEHADWWHGVLAESTVHTVQGSGHYVALVQWAAILDALT